jgi:hypothetical protein
VRILDYQKPNPSYYGQKNKRRLFDRFGGSMVGSALMPQGMSREDMPLQAPPRVPEVPERGGGGSKLSGIFLSAPPIPDRIGDVQQQRMRRANEQNRAWNNYHNDPGMFGQDGGMSPNDAMDRGDQIPEQRRQMYRRNDWSSKQSYEQGRGLWLPQKIDPRRRNQRA